MNAVKRLFIVIAEDDEDDAEMTFESFRNNASFGRVELVANGLELMEFLRASDPLPDAVLTDINMPVMDGLEALKKICGDETLRHIPTFVYSTAINPIYQAQCNELGTRAFLVKPIRLSDYDRIPEKICEILLNT